MNLLPALSNIFSLFGLKSANNQTTVAEVIGSYSIGEQIRFAKNMSIKVWEYARCSSVKYCKALDMACSDIESLEDLQGYVSVTLFNGQEVLLIPKNTCGCPYGANWEHLLQPRISDGELPNIGGGTSYVAVLPPEINQEIIKAIQMGNVVIKNGRIWP